MTTGCAPAPAARCRPRRWRRAHAFRACRRGNCSPVSTGAAGYALLHLEGARRWRFDAGELRTFVRVDNLLDQAYIGSVIVNEGNGRFFEPGPGRGVMVGAQWTWSR